ESQQAGGAMPEHESLIREAWLRTLSREPTADEAARGSEYFVATDSAVEALRDLLWALLNTKEFVLIK
ncbi:MAG: hypothetical protein ACO1RT_03205, partial [Planctomycetaceae bacterium]